MFLKISHLLVPITIVVNILVSIYINIVVLLVSLIQLAFLPLTTCLACYFYAHFKLTFNIRFSEQIFGYTGLRVKLYYSATRLTTYLSYTFDDKVEPTEFEGVKVGSLSSQTHQPYVLQTSRLHRETLYMCMGTFESQDVLPVLVLNNLFN